MKIINKGKAIVHSFNVNKERVHVLFYGKNPYGKLGGKCGKCVDATPICRTSGFRGAPNYFYELCNILNEISENKEIEISESALLQAAWRLSR